MSVTTLENGFYLTYPSAGPAFATRAIEVRGDKVQLVHGKIWFTVPQFFKLNTLVRKVTEEEADAA